MSSSGIKRGLATTAVSALALTGLPFMSGTAYALSNTAQFGADEVVLLSQYSGHASLKNDGQNTTVRLEAGGGANVSGVTFQYNTGNPDTWVTIATVTRNDNGAFSYEWDATALTGATVSLRALSVNNTTTDPDASDTRTSIEIYGAGAAAPSVNLNDGPELGYWTASYTSGGSPTPGDYAILTGTSSATAGTVDLVHFFNANTGTSGTPAGSGTISAPAGATTGTFAGIANLTGYDFTGSPDELSFGAALGTDPDRSDDVEAYELYKQVITTVTASPATVNSPDGTEDIVITVTDQKSKPIARVEVRAQDGTLIGYTNEAGKVTATGQTSGTRYYYANATDSDQYEPSVGDVKSNDVTVTPYTPAPTSLSATSRDGSAFDFDENNTVNATTGTAATDSDIKVQVKDQQGNNINTDGQTLSYYWTATPFDGSAAVRYPTGTAKWTASETGTGEYQIAFPKNGVEGTYALHASLGEVPVSGGGAIAEGPTPLLTVKAGQAEITYDEASPETGPAGGQEVVDGQLVLDDGTGLPGRTISLTLQYTAGASTDDDPTPDAYFLNENGTNGGTTQTRTTGTGGSFSVTVKDPAETPQLMEIGDNIDAATAAGTADADNPGATKNDHGVNFLVNTTPATVDIADTGDANGTSTAPKTAGTLQDFEVCVKSGDQDPNTAGVQSVPLTNEAVTLTTDHGYFTDGIPQGSVGGDAGYYDNDGQTRQYTTGSDGCVTVTLSIGKDTGFDDDGDVTATVTATAGSVSKSQSVYWTSEDPINAGQVTIEFAPASQQESSVLPKAPTTDSVRLLVKTFDQFGNRVGGESVALTDNKGDADVTTSVVTDYDNTWDASATSQSAGDQKITASWTNGTDVLVADGADAGSAPDVNTAGPNETVTDDLTINWYEVDYAASTYTITNNTGDDNVPAGTTVVVTYKAVDQFGEPIEDLYVSFFRTGPDTEQDGDGNYNAGTGPDGTVQYIYQGTKSGTATVTATGREGGPSGPVVPAATKSDTVTFTSSTTPTDPRDDVKAVLRGRNNGANPDRLRVDATRNAGGARVILYRIEKVTGKFIRLRAKTLDEFGDARFQVRDRNGRRLTQYIARVRGTVDTKPTITNRIRVR